MGSAAEGAVVQMEAMGFARTDIDRAMRAAFYNPDRAIEYLLTVSLSLGCTLKFLLTTTGYPR